MTPLTGLATRRVLDAAAQSALAGAVSVQGTSLIVLDVDQFKSINDRHGHPAGDEVLVLLAELLVRSSRRDDVVSRLGGDEMALLLPGCSVAALRRRAEQIVWDVQASSFVLSDGQELSVSVSVGLAHVPTDAVDLRSLYVKADQILYEAKRSGRNRVGIVADDSAVLMRSIRPPEAIRVFSFLARRSGTQVSGRRRAGSRPRNRQPGNALGVTGDSLGGRTQGHVVVAAVVAQPLEGLVCRGAVDLGQHALCLLDHLPALQRDLQLRGQRLSIPDGALLQQPDGGHVGKRLDHENVRWCHVPGIGSEEVRAPMT